MDLIAYINENYSDATLADNQVLTLSDDEDHDSICDAPSEESCYLDSLNLSGEISESLLQNVSASKSEDCKSRLGCFSLAIPNGRPIQVGNVKVESIGGLRSNSFCPALGIFNREAIASTVVITCNCKMNNWKIGHKNLTGSGKMSLTYNHIEYKSTKSEKSIHWSTIIDFSK